MSTPHVAVFQRPDVVLETEVLLFYLLCRAGLLPGLLCNLPRLRSLSHFLSVAKLFRVNHVTWIFTLSVHDQLFRCV